MSESVLLCWYEGSWEVECRVFRAGSTTEASGSREVECEPRKCLDEVGIPETVLTGLGPEVSSLSDLGLSSSLGLGLGGVSSLDMLQLSSGMFLIRELLLDF